MTTPVVTGFTALADLNGGKKGLNKTNNSHSPCEVTGTDLSADLPVNASNGVGVSWAGTLKYVNSKWTSNLTCTNNSIGVGDTEDVSVTVGSSPTYDAQVNVGT